MGAILQDFGEHWLLYLSIPLVAALIGYVTKILAIKMMFYPVDFRGKKPWLGWQGIVPKHAAKMAGIACDTLTEQLLSPQEVVERLDPERIVAEVEKPLRHAIEEIVEEVGSTYQPAVWEAMPKIVRRGMIQRVQNDAPRMLSEIMDEIKSDVDNVFDLKSMVVSALVRDKELLNRIFLEAGDKEFQFIRRSGAVFGFIIGLVQMSAWVVFKAPILMPLFGLFTGWFTDWLALKMIFRPQQPKTYLGLFEWQGLFLKRREEVSEAYGELIAREIITPRNVIEEVMRGPLSDKVLALVTRKVDEELSRRTSIAKPLVVFAVGGRRYQDLKNRIAEMVMGRLPETMSYVEDYAADAMDIRNTLVSKMKELDAEEFEELLRPAFREEEWMLIATGALLGFGVGEAQVLALEFLAT
ncbi:DUF445 domain-containing protein [Saccharopolyspora dendranthemae]|uniref:Uncharacterized membrane protein YheB (UPF0754 family) n=1 Tax=Saccharopolyspora dendranthemae TaxID=1181886 RepID=A0A561V788_9PSEU|nr:DUF445 domain-containing protein [Saccharopolyspora dendranthemae]TWG07479.1 uncharacterized membrane protein YheB (UPF0754 family) [Saccharopolyspora dendranthemae]